MTNGIRGFKPAAWLIGMLVLIAALVPLACTPGPDVEVVEHPLAEFDFMAEPWAEPGAEIPERRELPFRVEVTAVADSEAFSRPGHVYIDPADSERFVVDYYNSTVLRLTENLDVVTVYGKGRGDGPGEMQNPVGIVLDDDRRVYVADAYSRRVQIFAPDGQPEASIPLEGQAIGMIRGGAGLVVLTTAAEKSFRTYLFEDLLKAGPPQPTLEFGDLGSQPLGVMQAFGMLATAGPWVVYAQTYRPAIFVFDLSAQSYRAFATVDAGDYRPDDTAIEAAGPGVVVRPPPQTLYSGSVFASGDTLFVLSRFATTETETTVDAYRLPLGTYLGSMRIPRRISSLAGSGTDMLLMYRGEWVAAAVRRRIR